MLEEFLKLVKGFVAARCAMAAVDLGLFEALENGPLDEGELRDRLLVADSPIAEAFFTELESCRLIVRGGGQVSLSEMGQSVSTVHGRIQSWTREMRLLYTSLEDLTPLLRSGCYEDSALARYWKYKTVSEPKHFRGADVASYSRLMEESLPVEEILATQAFGTYGHVVDVGGGYGGLGMALAQAYPEMRVTIVDLPGVCEGASARIRAAGLTERVRCIPMDFRQEDLPEADAALFVRTLHDWPDEDARRLLGKAHGTIIILEPMGPPSLMLALLGGRRRTAEEYVDMLREVGKTKVCTKDCLSYKMVMG